MKKKIIILGSTGSIGSATLNLLNKNRLSFKVELLSANKNVIKLIKQADLFNVKNLIITDQQSFLKAKKKYKNKYNFFNDFKVLDKIFLNKEIYYTMISVIGLHGLLPTIKSIKFSQNIAIANKESLLCGWNLIEKELLKQNTNFIPIDSEHYSIYSLLKNKNVKNIEKIFITASGGPFLNFSKKKIMTVKIKDALKHPNWKMGKKITIDSSTMMNKIFEVIEAKNIFNLNYQKIEILTHPNSYLHCIIKYKNGIFEFLAHEPSMSIPIASSLNIDIPKKIKKKLINLNILNNLDLKKIDDKKFNLIKILKLLPNRNSLYETVLVTLNDFFVQKFLDKKISYRQLINYINKFANDRDFLMYRNLKPRKYNDIINLNHLVYLKLNSLGI